MKMHLIPTLNCPLPSHSNKEKYFDLFIWKATCNNINELRETIPAILVIDN